MLFEWVNDRNQGDLWVRTSLTLPFIKFKHWIWTDSYFIWLQIIATGVAAARKDLSYSSSKGVTTTKQPKHVHCISFGSSCVTQYRKGLDFPLSWSRDELALLMPLMFGSIQTSTRLLYPLLFLLVPLLPLQLCVFFLCLLQRAAVQAQPSPAGYISEEISQELAEQEGCLGCLSPPWHRCRFK